MKWIRGALVVVGVWMVVHAARGVYAGLGAQDLFHYVRYLIVAWLLNDLVLVPIVIGLGFLATRRLPPWAKPYAQGSLFVALSVVIVAYPLLTGHGKASDNPSALPRDYWVGLLVTLALIAAVATGLALRAFRANSSRAGAKKAEPPRPLEDS